MFFLSCVHFISAQNMTIEKNKSFKGNGYVISFTISDSSFQYNNHSSGFINGNSLYFDSLCNGFSQWNDHGYTKNTSLFKNELRKLSYYPSPQRRLREFIYPKQDSLRDISTYLAYLVRSDTLPLKLKEGVYFRVIKVKMEGWLIDFHNFKQLRGCYLMTPYDKDGKMRLSQTVFKEFEPVFGIDSNPYTVIVPKKVLFYTDWILQPKIADLLAYFYKNLYIGPEKERVIYPEALKYLLENDH
jgi:hypothetical protein